MAITTPSTTPAVPSSGVPSQLHISTFLSEGAPSHPEPVSLGADLGGAPITAAPRRSRALWTLGCDLVALVASFAIGAVLRAPLGSREGPTRLVTSLSHEAAYAIVFVLTLGVYGLYHRARRRLRGTSFLDLGTLLHGLAAGAVATMAISAVIGRLVGTPKIGWMEALFMTIPAMLLIPAARGLGAAIDRRRGMVRSRVIVIGSGSVATALTRRLAHCSDIEVVGFIDDDPFQGDQGMPVPWLGSITELSDACTRLDIDRVLVAFSASEPSWIMDTLRTLPQTVRISIVPRLFELVTWQSQMEELHGLTVMDVAPPHLDLLSRTLKRTLDIVVGAGALLILSPVMLAIALAVKASSPGPVLFRQPRVGRRGTTFSICKFRTMEDGADFLKLDLREQNQVDGPLFKLHDDPRVTRVGRWLRKTSLDELPQLLNVVVGQMSLVGPRPFVVHESAGIDGWAARRFDVRPGMTGLWQTSGRNDLPFEELRRLDYAYVASWSLSWDLKILWHTPSSVLRGHGAY